jgi:DNA-binding transcriptional ArsR family regulator
MGEDARVWKALSSPHRRALLDALRDGPMTTTALCEVLPGLSRFAVMQHLGVLERAGIVLVQRELERWLNVFQQATASQLLAFERHMKEE